MKNSSKVRSSNKLWKSAKFIKDFLSRGSSKEGAEILLVEMISTAIENIKNMKEL